MSIVHFLKVNQEKLIKTYTERFLPVYPGYYSEEVLQQQAARYCGFLLDLHIPCMEHPVYKMIPEFCEKLSKRGIPNYHILRSNLVWRVAFLQVLRDYPDMKQGWEQYEEIMSRIDYFELAVFERYQRIIDETLSDKDDTINQLHEERLAVIGKMAASMAHEIRNPLTAVKGFLHLLKTDINSGSPKKTDYYLSIIEGEFQNIQMQITGLLSFSKKQVIEETFQLITMNRIMDSVFALISPRIMFENINVSMDVSETPLHVQRIGVQQVISNIINNSIDALTGQNRNKEITIRGYRNEACYCLSIKNNGPEIPDSIKNTLFSPFVTDKQEGTGLGLAICKSIMGKNGGRIWFASNPEETEFILEFPLKDI